VLDGRLDEALRTLGEGRFHVWEGERGIHAVYVQVRLDRGQRLLAAGAYEAALGEFRSAVDVPSNIEVGRDAEAHLAVVRYHEGLALAKLGRADEAEGAFRASAEAPTKSTTDHYWVGRSLEKLDREAEARTHFDRLAGTKPVAVNEAFPLERRMAAREARAEAYYARALGLLGLGRETEARTALKRAVETDPDNVAAAALERSFPARSEPRPGKPKARPQVEAPPRFPAEAPLEKPPAEDPPEARS
jgi:tetratricopeptide (TPR) repeat protein